MNHKELKRMAAIFDAHIDPPPVVIAKKKIAKVKQKYLTTDSVADLINSAEEGGRHKTNLNAFACLDSTEKTEPYLHPNAACYMGINSKVNANTDMIALYLNQGGWGKVGRIPYGAAKLNEHIFDTWIDYLANESPYADAFLTKDAVAMRKAKIAYFDATGPANLVIGAMTHARQPWEYGKVPEAFEFFTRTLPDVNKDFLLYASHCFQVNERGSTIVPHTEAGNHIALTPQFMDKAIIKSFMAHKPKTLLAPLCNGGGYRGITSMYGTANSGYTKNLHSSVRSGKAGNAGARVFSWNTKFLQTEEGGNIGAGYDLSNSIKIINDLYQRDFT